MRNSNEARGCPRSRRNSGEFHKRSRAPARAFSGIPENARAVTSGRWQYPAPRPDARRVRLLCAGIRYFAFIPCSATNTEVMEMDEEKLIYLVQMYDCLYNIKSRHYSDKHMKNNAWQKVGAEMNMSGMY
jgi:hypothetical protein